MKSDSIQLNELTLERGERTLLGSVSQTINLGDFVALIGPNGVGKSSLLKSIAGLQNARAGQITIPEHLTIGYAPDSPPLYDNDTIYIYLKFIAKLQKLPKTRVDETLELLNLKDIKRQRIATLSCGQKQMVNLAQAIMCRPSLLLLDEPTNGLDNPIISSFCEILEDLRTTNTTIIIATHQYSEFISNCDYMLKIHCRQLETIFPPLKNATIEEKHDRHHYST